MVNKIDDEAKRILKELALYRAGLEGLPRKLTFEETNDLMKNIFKKIERLLTRFDIDWTDYTGKKKKNIIKEPDKKQDEKG